MLTVCDVAAFFLKNGGPMTAMKLQKLAYYAQVWSLVLLNKPLFVGEIQAWPYGPVILDLYKEHRRQFIVTEISSGDAKRVQSDPQVKQLLEQVFRHYGKFDGVELSRLTHSEEPWKKARKNILGNDPSRHTISENSITEFYGKKTPPF